MPTPLNVLILEDRPDDAELMINAMRKGGFEPHWARVEGRADFQAALADDLDLILADYTLPQFDALGALRDLQATGLDIPLIVVTGSISEEVAVECMKQGAADYLIKDRLARLAQAIERALQDKQLRAEKRRADIMQRETEQALRQREQQLSTIFDTFGDAITLMEVEPDGGYRYAAINPAVTSMTGLEYDQVLAKRIEEVMAQPALSAVLEHFDQAIREKRTVTWETTFEFPAGRLYAEVSAAPIFDETDRCSHLVTWVHDVTEKKRAEETRMYLASIVEASNDGISSNTLDGRYVSWNKAAERIYGFTAEDMIGRSIEVTIPAERLPEVDHIWAKMRAGQRITNFETQRLRKDGQLIDVSLSVAPLRDAASEITGVSVIARDITQTKLVERELSRAIETLGKRNADLDALYRVGQIINSTLDIDAILGHLVDEAMRITSATHGQVLIVERERGVYDRRSLRGFSTKEAEQARTLPLPLDKGVNGRAYSRRQTVRVDDVTAEADYHPLIASTRSELSMPIIQGDQVIGNLDLQSPKVGAFRDSDLGYLKALADLAAIAVRNAQLYHELESHSEILVEAVEQRTAELQQTKEHIEAILDSVGEALVVVSKDGRIQQVNPAFEQQTGYSAPEVELQDHRMLLHDHATPPEVFQQSSKAMRAGRGWSGEMPVRRRDGTIYQAAVTISPMRDADGKVTAFVGAMRDISPLKEVERMKDQFVSNVSHELRTPITSMLLNCRLLEQDIKADRHPVYVARIGRELERLNLMVEGLLRLSRLDQGKVELELAALDLNTLAAQYVSDRAPLATENGLTLTVSNANDVAPVLADSGLLGQAVSVLLTNALNYTPSGGSVTLRTQTTRWQKTRWSGISVSDTGPGITAEEQDKLFQRFFRGKAGRASHAPGTGLGLAIAKEIVDRHHGRIEVTSQAEPGQGATFTIWLPVDPTASG